MIHSLRPLMVGALLMTIQCTQGRGESKELPLAILLRESRHTLSGSNFGGKVNEELNTLSITDSTIDGAKMRRSKGRRPINLDLRETTLC
jgi:hypothetical protein